MIASGPEVVVTASRCDGLRSSSRRSREGVAVNEFGLDEGRPPAMRGPGWRVSASRYVRLIEVGGACHPCQV